MRHRLSCRNLLVKSLVEVNLNFSASGQLPIPEDSKDDPPDSLTSVNKLILHVEAQYFGVLFDPVGSHLDIHLNVPQLEMVDQPLILKVVD